MKRIEFSESMDEISGFGGFYERCCRAAVVAGARWLAEHPGVEPVFKEFAGIFGLATAENDVAKSLEEAIVNALVTRDDGTKSALRDELTGAQFHAAAHHLTFIAKNGWDAYVEQMTSPPLKEGAA